MRPMVHRALDSAERVRDEQPMSALPEAVTAWQSRGVMRNVCGYEVFVVDTGPADALEAVLVLHGFPTSSLDWHLALPALRTRRGAAGGERRVVLFDFIGFGLSEKPVAFSYSLHEQADLALVLARELGVERAHLVAHDMGTSVACEILARRARALAPIDVRSLVLMNGSVHIELASLTPSQKILLGPAGRLFARVASRRVFVAQLRRILGMPVGDTELDAMWAGLAHRGGVERLPQSIGYVRERWRFAERWIGALERLDLPALVLWGPLDPVAVFTIAERLAGEIPGARLEVLDGLGHYPQLEDPSRTGAAIARFLDDVERR